MKWSTAFVKAIKFVLYSLIWVIIGIAIIFAGFLMSGGALLSSIAGAVLSSTPPTNLFASSIPILVCGIIGYLVMFIGIFATAIKVYAEVIADEVWARQKKTQ